MRKNLKSIWKRDGGRRISGHISSLFVLFFFFNMVTVNSKIRKCMCWDSREIRNNDHFYEHIRKLQESICMPISHLANLIFCLFFVCLFCHFRAHFGAYFGILETRSLLESGICTNAKAFNNLLCCNFCDGCSRSSLICLLYFVLY